MDTDEGIGCGVGFIKCVTREFLHEIEDLIGELLLNSVLTGSQQKLLTHFGHFFGLFLTHGATQQVCLSQRETRQHLSNLHHLFLIQHYAVSGIQHRLQAWMRIRHGSFAMFTVNVVVHCTRLQRTGPKQRH